MKLTFIKQNFTLIPFKLFKNLLFILSLIVFPNTNSIGQTIEQCGTRSLTEQEFQNVLQFRKENSEKSTLRSNSQIPIHYVIIYDGAGKSPFSPFDDMLLNEWVEYANSKFTNGMSFYICNVSIYDNSASADHYEINPQNNNELQSLYNLYHDDNAITVYVVNNLIGFAAWATYPDNPLRMIVMEGDANTGNDVPVFAHELGHYFGLFHTNEGFTSGQNPNNTCFGDGICDTDVDPGKDICGNSCTSISCTVGGITYGPDKTNIMGLYNFCRNSFSSEQLSVMSTNLNNHANLSHLSTPPSSSSCIAFAIDAKGYIERVDDFNGNNTSPINNAFIDIVEGSNSCQTITKGVTDIFYQPYSSCKYVKSENSTVTLLPQRDKLSNDPSQQTFEADNGVTVTDKLLITRHILNIQSFNGPYQLIAADVNRNGSITAFDEVLINRVVLQIDPTFSVAKSWQYVPNQYLENTSFQNAFNANPFTAVYSGSKTYSGFNSYLNEIDIDLNNINATNDNAWSFKAIKMGDVNFNSTFFTLRGSDQTVSRSNESSKLDYFIEPLSGNCLEEGEEFTLEIKAEGLLEIAAYQFGFSFNKELLDISGVQRSSFGEFDMENFGLTRLGKGELRTIWTSKKGINLKVNNNNRKLFKLRLKALQPICDLASAIKLDDDILESFFIDENLNRIEGRLVIEPKSTGGNGNISSHRLIRVYPNPTQNDLSFQFNLSSSVDVTISVADQNGASVLLEDSFEKGTHKTPIRDIQKLKAGLLFYTVILGEDVFTGTAIKL